MTDVFQVLRAPLTQTAFAFEPASPPELRLSDTIAWTFSVLMGRYKSNQLPLVCGETGLLSVGLCSAVDGAALAVATGGGLNVTIKQGNELAHVADWYDLDLGAKGLYVWDYFTKQVYDILIDVFDILRHSLRVTQTP